MRQRLFVLLLAAVLWPTAAQSDAPFLVEATFDTAWAYPGQAVIYTVIAYSDTARDVEFDLPAFEGFWQSESRAVTGGSATVNGKQYSTTIHQVSLFPQRPGMLRLAPARVTYLETVFSAGAIRMSNDAALEVLELPPAPEDFSGLVGAVGARFSAVPDVVRIGEPIEITLRVQGAANLAQWSAPTPVLPDGWRIYPEPRTSAADFDGSVLTQARVIRWRAVPDRAGRAELAYPPLTVFTLANGYETIEIAPLSFEVLPGPNGELSRESITAAINSLSPLAPEQIAAGRVPVAIWVAAPLLALSAFAWKAGLRQWRRMRAAARYRNAMNRAAQRLRPAARVDGNLPAVEAAVTGYFADRGIRLGDSEKARLLLIDVESERYNPDGPSKSPVLARRAVELLREIERQS